MIYSAHVFMQSTKYPLVHHFEMSTDGSNGSNPTEKKNTWSKLSYFYYLLFSIYCMFGWSPEAMFVPVLATKEQHRKQGT